MASAQAFDNTLQKMVGMSGIRMETGSGVTIAGETSTPQTFTVATKLKKVISGFGVMDYDGMNAIATTGIVSNGQVEFTRKAPITTESDKFTYQLFGF